MNSVSRWPLLVLVLLGCTQDKGVSPPEALLEPFSGLETRIEGIVASNGQLLVVASILRPDGVVAWAQRLDASGAPVGTSTFLPQTFFPNDQHDLRFPALRVAATASGWAFVDIDTPWAGFIDAQGALTSQSIASVTYPIGLGATSGGLALFDSQPCSAGTCIVRDDIAATGGETTQTIAQTSLLPAELGVELAPNGGVIAQVSQKDGTTSTLQLDASGAPIGTWTPGPIVAVAAPPASALLPSDRIYFAGAGTRGADHAFLVVRDGSPFLTFDVLVAKSDGTFAQSQVMSGPAFGFAATPSGYRVASECNLDGCFYDFDANGSLVGTTTLDPRDADHPGCTLARVVADGAGGRAVSLCYDTRGLLVRTASLDDPTHWTDGWRVPGLVRGLNVRTSPAGVIAEVQPSATLNDLQTTWAIPLDATGVPGQPNAETANILAATPTGYLGSTFHAVAFMDSSANVVSTAPVSGSVFAAVWTDDHAIVKVRDDNATSSYFALLGQDGTLSSAITPDAVGWAPHAFCPAASDGVVLAIDVTATGSPSVRRMRFDATWADASGVELSAAPGPTLDCWTCGASCWVIVASDGTITRTTAPGGALTVTSVATLPSGVLRAAGDADGGLVALLDESQSLTLHPLDASGAPTGETSSIPIAPMPSENGLISRVAVGALGGRRYVVVSVSSTGDGREEAVSRIVQL